MNFDSSNCDSISLDDDEIWLKGLNDFMFCWCILQYFFPSFSNLLDHYKYLLYNLHEQYELDTHNLVHEFSNYSILFRIEVDNIEKELSLFVQARFFL